MRDESPRVPASPALAYRELQSVGRGAHGEEPEVLPRDKHPGARGRTSIYHVQSVASCRLDDPGARECVRRPPSTSASGGRRSGAHGYQLARASVTPAFRERCCSCHSPALRPWTEWPQLAQLRIATVLRGGALEPGARVANEKLQAKADVFLRIAFTVRIAQRAFLSQAGPRALLCFLKLSITSLKSWEIWFRNDEGDPLGRPRRSRTMAHLLSLCAPYEGRHPTDLTIVRAFRAPGRQHDGCPREALGSVRGMEGFSGHG